ncbi:MAG: hypothetical protein Kow00108_06850 [Calditrichia bacterium]
MPIKDMPRRNLYRPSPDMPILKKGFKLIEVELENSIINCGFPAINEGFKEITDGPECLVILEFPREVLNAS